MAWTGPTGNYGSEFYAGNAEKIGSACRAQEWERMRNGELGIAFAGFPPCVKNTDVLFFLLPVATRIMGLSAVTLHNNLPRVAQGVNDDAGLWVAELLPKTYVLIFAMVSSSLIDEITDSWRKDVLNDIDEEDEDWYSPEVRNAVAEFIELCHIAIRDKQDVVEIWIH